MNILIINSGSSSLKIKLFAKQKKSLSTLFDCQIEAIGQKHAQIVFATSKKQKKTIKKLIPDQKTALSHSLDLLLKSGIIKNLLEIEIVGHRVVHGGEKFKNPVIIDKYVVKQIKKLSKLAPLHNPANLIGIKNAQKLLKNSTQIAVFDTAFHQTIPEKAFMYALPIELYQKNKYRKYGFHGTSHKYVSEIAIKELKKRKQNHQKIITCHIGNGVSITAVDKGKSVDTSMGFTPLEGVMMGTRSGSIDPSLPLQMLKDLKKLPLQINKILNNQSGLLGISKINSDYRLIDKAAQKKNNKAKLAIDMFAYQLAKQISSFAATLNGLDALVFTAGIGEHSSSLRKKVCDYLEFLDLKLDHGKNIKNGKFINSNNSKIKVLCIPTNEEQEIANECLKLKQ
ncbi:acetate/propionate family kinase [Candidatus Peregrinibacteria bacterium]|nr:acetate/propionate family kinase [Candidatus Peregrinibacteria bacterium]